MEKRSVVLIVLDGWGLGDKNESNPIHVVNPKSFEYLRMNYPMTSLQASGISVGLPWGEVGNSEVGHLTLGAGKVVYQYYPRITIAIRDRSFFQILAFKNAFEHAKKNNSAINLVGLLSKGNVHASLDHLLALIEFAEMEGVTNIKLHLFSDGKDSPPHTLQRFLEEIPKDKLKTLVGRYYGMDRNGNWQLTKTAYDCIAGKGGTTLTDPAQIIEETYKRGFTEEFLQPIRFGENAEVNDNDAVIFFNYREDSIRQLAEAFIIPSFDKFPIKKFQNLYIATMTHYEDSFSVPVGFPPDTINECLGRVLSDNGKNQLRLAETYKYAHVTYFFNGYKEAPFKNEYRVLIPSFSTLHPEMMASAITDRLLEAIRNQAFDFILVNYANSDTMAHTANYEASVKAVQVIDQEIKRVLEVVEKTPTTLIITSDHGNVERLLDLQSGQPESQHDANPVPLYLVGQEYRGKKFSNFENLEIETIGLLSDVAPTILKIMGLEKPDEMNGRDLLEDLR